MMLTWVPWMTLSDQVTSFVGFLINLFFFIEDLLDGVLESDDDEDEDDEVS